jgi:hypothetical protein
MTAKLGPDDFGFGSAGAVTFIPDSPDMVMDGKVEPVRTKLVLVLEKTAAVEDDMNVKDNVVAGADIEAVAANDTEDESRETAMLEADKGEATNVVG